MTFKGETYCIPFGTAPEDIWEMAEAYRTTGVNLFVEHGWVIDEDEDGVFCQSSHNHIYSVSGSFVEQGAFSLPAQNKNCCMS